MRESAGLGALADSNAVQLDIRTAPAPRRRRHRRTRADATRFDTIKVRLQTSPPERFKGPLDCLLSTVRNEGFRGVYKGATPPLVGWVFMDSVCVSPGGVARARTR